MLAYDNDRVRWAVAAAVVLTILGSSLFFSVPEGSVAVVTRFGAPVRVYRQAGLHAKLPLPFERAYVLDARKRLFETRLTETLTSDKKNVILVTYAVWKIADPVRYLEAVGDAEGAEAKLDGVITNAKNAVLGHYGFSALVSRNPQEQRLDQIEQEMLTGVREEARTRYGADVLQVGIERLALPEDNTKFVFDEMRAERAQYAARFRAEGEREAARIRAATDLTTARLRAEGTEQADKIRGNAEAEAARIYAAAHKQDPQFYRFVRSLDALKKTLGDNATVVLDTDSPPFNVLKHPER